MVERRRREKGARVRVKVVGVVRVGGVVYSRSTRVEAWGWR